MKTLTLFLIAASMTAAAAPLEMDFRGNLEIRGLVRERIAMSRKPVKFAPRGGVALGPEQVLKIASEDKLSSENGTLVMRLMPLDWEGDNRKFQFFLHCRNHADGSIVMLQKSTDGKLTFLIGHLKKFSKVSADIGHWKRGQWHTVQVNWTRECMEIFLDGRMAGKAARRYAPLTLPETIEIGGRIFSPCEGETAIGLLKISPEVLPLQTVPDAGTLQKNSAVPARNIATAAYQAVMLPSSQWTRDRSQSIEQAEDGNPDSCYLSGRNDGEHWVEVRWPHPVTLDGVQAMGRSPETFTSYQVKIPVNKQWRTVLEVNSHLEDLHHFAPYFADRVRIEFQDKGQLALQELYVTGEAPRMTLKAPCWPGFFIWYPEDSPDNVIRYFRKNFQIGQHREISRAMLQICCDDAYTVYLNGRFVGSGGFVPDLHDVTGILKSGRNTIAVKAREFTICEGVLAELTLIWRDGKTERICTDSSWLASREAHKGWTGTEFDDSRWQKAVRSRNLGEYAKNIPYRYFGSDGPGFELKKLTVSPEIIRPGQQVEIKALFISEKKTEEDYGFRLEIGEEARNPAADYTILKADAETATTSGWMPGTPYEISWRVTVPVWAPHGRWPLKIRPLCNGREAALKMQEQHFEIIRFDWNPKPDAQPLKAGLENRGGQLRMVINGEIVAPPIFTVNSFNNSFRLLGESGAIKADLYRLQMMSDNIYPQKTADKELFYRQKLAMIDQDIRNFLRIYPDARILWGMTFRPENAWNDDYPDEVAMFPDGTRTKNSFSSEIWLDMSVEWIQRMVTHMRKSDYAGHIAGFHFGIGDGAEAMYWGRTYNPFNTPREKVAAGDFSPAAQTNFHQWLRRKYRNDVDALRKAWKKPNIDFDTASPDMAELRREEQQNFRNPATGTMAMDYWSFHGDSMADAAIRIAGAFKQACSHELLVGVYGFYNLAQLHLIYHPASSHHVAYTGIGKILDCRDIDFIACIQSYAGVNAGTPVITGMPDASLRKHGKLFLEEYDIRTFFTDLTFTHSHTTSQNETLNIIRRDFGETLVRGNQCWFYGFPRGFTGRRAIGWFSEESLIRELNTSHAIGRASNLFANRSAAEVALFVNPSDIVTMDIMDAPGTLINTQYNTVYRELKTMAIPYDCYLLGDLKAENIAHYKVVIILNAFYLSKDERARLRQLLEEQRKTVLWLYAPGYSDPVEGLSANHIRELTGIGVGVLPEFRETLTVRMNGGEEFSTYRYPHDRRRQQIGPVFYINDRDSEILGVYKDTHLPAIARKTLGGMNSIYCALPIAGRQLLEKLFRENHVHFYSDNPMYLNASRYFLCIHAITDMQEDIIKLPGTRWVFDLINRKIVTRNQNHFSLTMKGGQTALYFMGTQEEVKKLTRMLTENECTGKSATKH